MSGQRALKTSREQVVTAALRVLDESGLEGLTIRGVAAAAGASPMSLYTHFSKKEQLLDLMYEQISRLVYPGPEHPDWQSALKAFCHSIRRLLLQHPEWIPLMSRPAPVVALPHRERLLSLMTSTGLTAEQSLSLLSSAGLFALGFTLVELSSRDEQGVSGLIKRYENLRACSEGDAFAEQNPVTRQALSSTPTLDLSEKFSTMVDAFVAGLQLQARHV
jgi:AcrR family transcriptional regulator